MFRLVLCAALAAASIGAAPAARAFCGFYVGKADASLFNDASRVIFVRDGPRSTITMLNDYRGDLREFAMVVPVPQVLAKDAVRVADRRVFDRIDAYTAPRLAEYFDPDPCATARMDLRQRAMPMSAAPAAREASREKALGVAVEASWTVGEYDIVILSATQSNGLETWLRENGYRMPAGAARALAPYVKQGLKFFVAKVNLAEQAKTGSVTLRPLQFAFDHDRFGLPIRLGMLNARGPQDLVLYVLTRNGRVESTNYRTVKLPANMDVPVHVRGEFPQFYKALFDEQARREAHRVVFTEYFWDMSWCDPCAADPLTADELRQAGVGWIDAPPPASGDVAPAPNTSVAPAPAGRRIAAPATLATAAPPVMVTRLHIRYARDTFPEDLMFHETKDRANFQTRYVLRHAWKGDPAACPEAARYFEGVTARQEQEARSLAQLTGQSIDDVRARMGLRAAVSPSGAAEQGATGLLARLFGGLR